MIVCDAGLELRHHDLPTARVAHGRKNLDAALLQLPRVDFVAYDD